MSEDKQPPEHFDFWGKRVFSKVKEDPYHGIERTKRDVKITDIKGAVVFEQAGVEAPSFWSDTAVTIVASKYFYDNGKGRESSVFDLIDRVANTITGWAMCNCEMDVGEKDVFCDELKYLLIHQYASFNSPVWFNVGVRSQPQCSACFINSVDDDMESILDLAKTEGMLFRYGSGSGTNFSRLRAEGEPLSGGGTASGPLSFMKGYDAFAGVIKSGGKTRRAAKMVILDDDHPDIEKFVGCKVREETKAKALEVAGYSGGMDGEATSSVFFQNSNNSVRVTDAFMQCVKEDTEWSLRNRTGGTAKTVRAKDLFRQIAAAAHTCGDPGIQFHDTVNEWNTCSHADDIRASNPCSEYMFLDNSACNLASLNLLKFLSFDASGRSFDYEKFVHAVRIMIVAQDSIIDNASYPTKEIEENSKRYRPLGLGYANLGALLMSMGISYGSSEGRHIARCITHTMTCEAYRTSVELAAFGPFEGYCEDSFIPVLKKHEAEANLCLSPSNWGEVRELAEYYGVRNAQVTALAPTGTIGFMMDCDTTGIEPALGLVTYKQLSNGGVVKKVNKSVRLGLETLGYSQGLIKQAEEYVLKHGTLKGCIDDKHLPIFQCALGDGALPPEAHVDMMAAVQPALSGAISKTVNLPHDATVEDIERIYISAHEQGLKSIAVYRDGCKATQPMSVMSKKKGQPATPQPPPRTYGNPEPCEPTRTRLQATRDAVTHKFSVAGHEGYLTVGMYDNGSPGELFITMSKEGSTVSGLMDTVATLVSIGLQYGIPLLVMANKLMHTRYEPAGYTGNKDIPLAMSITDYVFRWLALRFSDERDRNSDTDKLPEIVTTDPTLQTDAPPCATCGSIMTRNGSCYKCANCGSTSGCS